MMLDGTGWGIAAAAAIVAEIDRDLGDREAQYPELVSKGRLDQREADYRILVIRDIRADLLLAFAPLQPGEIGKARENCDVPWADKVRWLNRELADRTEQFPALVRKGRLDGNEAQIRIAAIRHLRRLYWNSLFQWEPAEGAAADYLRQLREAKDPGTVSRDSHGAILYRELVRRHLEIVAAETGGQGELAA